jgi:hypothetical protein
MVVATSTVARALIAGAAIVAIVVLIFMMGRQ